MGSLIGHRSNAAPAPNPQSERRSRGACAEAADRTAADDPPRIATLGEEVEDPAITIPRAVPRVLAAVLAVYLVVGVTALAVMPASALAATSAPLHVVIEAGRLDGLAPVVIALVVVLDLRSAIGISGVAVLTYYAITNAAALTLRPEQRRWPALIAVVGLLAA